MDVEAFAQEVHEIATAAAAGIEHAHARPDAAAQQLIEQVDVDVAELGLQIHQSGPRLSSHAGVPDVGVPAPVAPPSP